jgi:hypothetical protein
MPKTNYAYEKRQRELERKRKKEDKAQRKAATVEPGVAAPPRPTAEDATSLTEPQSLT